MITETFGVKVICSLIGIHHTIMAVKVFHVSSMLTNDSKVHRPTEYISPFPSIYGNIATRILEVEEGDLVVFPSFLLHVAPPSGVQTSQESYLLLI